MRETECAFNDRVYALCDAIAHAHRTKAIWTIRRWIGKWISGPYPIPDGPYDADKVRYVLPNGEVCKLS